MQAIRRKVVIEVFLEKVGFENLLGGKDGDKRLLGESHSRGKEELEQRPRGRPKRAAFSTWQTDQGCWSGALGEMG